MKQTGRITLCVAMLLVSLLASLLQFHNHDCHGHAEFDLTGAEITLGCNHGHNACHKHAERAGSEQLDGCGHLHDCSECALHLQPSETASQIFCSAPLLTQTECFCLNSWPLVAEAELSDVTNQRSTHFRIKESEGFNCKLTPRRGSPIMC